LILYVLRYYPTRTETFAHLEARELPGVEVAAFDRREGEVDPNLRLHAQPHGWQWLAALPALVVEWLRAPTADRRVLWLSTLVRRARRVHVHFAGEAAVWTREACRRAGVPYSVTVHAVDLWKPHPALDLVLRDAVAVVTVSEANRRELARRGVGAELVRCGVPIGCRPGPRDVVLCVARDVPKKGLDLYVALARAMPEVAFVLVSDLPDPQLANLHVTGLLPHERVRDWIQRAGLFVLPCRVAPDGDRDGIPVVLLEALGASVPVVTTAVAGIAEIVDAEVGWLVPADDPTALLATVRMAWADPAERRVRGDAGPARLRALGCTTEAQVAAMAQLLGVEPEGPDDGSRVRMGPPRAPTSG